MPFRLDTIDHDEKVAYLRPTIDHLDGLTSGLDEFMESFLNDVQTPLETFIQQLEQLDAIDKQKLYFEDLLQQHTPLVFVILPKTTRDEIKTAMSVLEETKRIVPIDLVVYETLSNLKDLLPSGESETSEARHIPVLDDDVEHLKTLISYISSTESEAKDQSVDEAVETAQALTSRSAGNAKDQDEDPLRAIQDLFNTTLVYPHETYSQFTPAENTVIAGLRKGAIQILRNIMATPPQDSVLGQRPLEAENAFQRFKDAMKSVVEGELTCIGESDAFKEATNMICRTYNVTPPTSPARTDSRRLSGRTLSTQLGDVAKALYEAATTSSRQGPTGEARAQPKGAEDTGHQGSGPSRKGGS